MPHPKPGGLEGIRLQPVPPAPRTQEVGRNNDHEALELRARRLQNQVPAEVLQLALLLSMAVELTPALVRDVRLSLCPKLPVETEVLLWLSPMLQSASRRSGVFYSQVGLLLRHLAVEACRPDQNSGLPALTPDLLERAWKKVDEHHRFVAPVLRLQSELQWLSMKGSIRPGLEHDVRARRQALLKQVVASAVANDRGAIRWVYYALPTLESDLQEENEARLARVAALTRVAGMKLPPLELPLSELELLNQLPALLPPEFRQVPVKLELNDQQVRLFTDRESGIWRLPDLDPLLVRVTWTPGEEEPRWHRLEDQQLLLSIPKGAERLTLHNAQGDGIALQLRGDLESPFHPSDRILVVNCHSAELRLPISEREEDRPVQSIHRYEPELEHGIAGQLREYPWNEPLWNNILEGIREQVRACTRGLEGRLHVFCQAPHAIGLWVGRCIEQEARTVTSIAWQFDIRKRTWGRFQDEARADETDGQFFLDAQEQRFRGSGRDLGLGLWFTQHPSQELLTSWAQFNEVARLIEQVPQRDGVITSTGEAARALREARSELERLRREAPTARIHLLTSAPIAFLIELGRAIRDTVYRSVIIHHYQAADAQYYPLLDVVSGKLVPLSRSYQGELQRDRRAALDQSDKFFEDELQRYLRAALTLYQSLPLLGVNPELKLTLGVDDVYVPLKGVRSRNIYKSDKWQGEPGIENSKDDIELSQVFARAEGTRGVVILGDPGSGKTTLLKLLLVRCIKEGGTALGLPADIVPVMLPLRDLKGDADLDTFYSRHLKENTLLWLSPDFPRALRESRPLLYLLDGLDDVPDEAERARVSRWIQSGLASHIRAYFAVTCRYAGYQGEARLDDHFVELNVRPLNEADAQALVKNFYRIVARQQHGDTHLAAVNAKERSEHLWGLLCGESFRTRRMRELQSNPLLLTIVCLVHQRYNDLPDRRWRLYEQCVDTLLWHWRKAIGLKLPFDLEESRRFLLPLAWWLHQEEKRRHATSDELVAAIQEPLSLLNVSPERLKQFLKDVRDRSGLLVGWSADSYGFIHLAFQEHLAALHLKNASHENQAILDEAARHFGESWWTEVLLLLVSLPEPPLFEPFMRRVLAGDGFARLEHRQLLSDVVADASVRTPVPFLEVAANPARSEEARYAALWAIRGMEEQKEQVIATCRELLQSGSSSLRDLARGLLAERGTTVEQPLRAGSLWVHQATGLEFVYVPPGQFRMGSNDVVFEQPIHEVEFKLGFWIGKYPVTNAQYARFMRETQHQEPAGWQNREFNGPEQPVVGVDWTDAIAFTRWADGRLSEEDGRAPDGASRIHLPSEAEWEYAARGPESRTYPWGEADPTPELANFNRNVGRPTPVGQYAKGASWVGAFDMAGNVWEWCVDTWHESYHGAPVDGSAWVRDGKPAIRVFRGGSWDYDAERLRGSGRGGNQGALRLNDWGFRVVLVSAEQTQTGEGVDIWRRAGGMLAEGTSPADSSHDKKANTPTSTVTFLDRQPVQETPVPSGPELGRSRSDHGKSLWKLGKRADALVAMQEAVAEYRHQAQQAPDVFTPDLANCLNYLGNMLGEMRRWEEALAATQEAVTLFRKLTQQVPDAFISELATSLTNLGNRFSDLGQRKDARAATQEAVILRRRLAERAPGDAALSLALARSLNNLGVSLTSLGLHEEALTSTEEAVTILRRLAEQVQDEVGPNLALGLNTLGNCLSNLGRREEALAATQEAVTVFRTLAGQAQDTRTGDLAGSLTNLGSKLSDLGRREEAVTAIEEAVGLQRSLAQQAPEQYNADLAGSLIALGSVFASQGRKEKALAATQEAVTLYRQLALVAPDAFTPDLARSLNNLGLMLSDLGRPDQALSVAEEAVTVFRKLAEQLPESSTPDLAMSLNTLGKVHGALGLHNEALSATEEAVIIFRRLAEQLPDIYSPMLAMCLNNLGSMLHTLGRNLDALAATEEAVTLRRRLAMQAPDIYTSDLAGSLSDLGVRYRALDRQDEALAATQEAVTLLRPIAEQAPDAHAPDLATILFNLSGSLSALGRWVEALAAIEEAVAIYRRLAEHAPDAHAPDLATSLFNLSGSLSALGRWVEALAAIEEAVAIYRRLAEHAPDAHAPDLAKSLTTLGNRLSTVGRLEEALAATEEAVALHRRLAEQAPDAHTPDLARSLNNLGNRLNALGQQESALAATQEAVTLHRRLAEQTPKVFLPDLGLALVNLGSMFSSLGLQEKALATAEEAVTLYRHLTEQAPGAFTPDLARSLNNLSGCLSASGQREDALAATAEAVALYRRMAEQAPASFASELAKSLNNHGTILSTLGRREEALAVAREAVICLTPYFFRLPQAYVHDWLLVARNLRRRCQDSGIDPASDPELKVIMDHLKELEAALEVQSSQP